MSKALIAVLLVSVPAVAHADINLDKLKKIVT